MDGGGGQVVLLLIIEEPAGQLDLIHRTHGQLSVAQNGAAHLKPGDGLFDHHLPVVAERLFHRGDQVILPRHPADAEGRAGPYGLDKHRVSQRPGQGGHLLRPVAPAKHAAPGHLYPGQADQLVRPPLVHAQGAAQRAAPDEGDADQLDQPLHRAILPVFAVQDGECRVKIHGPSALQQQPPGAPIQGQGAGRAPLPPPIPIGLVPAVEPAPRPGDAHDHRYIPLPPQAVHHRPGRLAGSLVLSGAPAEYTQNPFHTRPSKQTKITWFC